MAEKILAIIFMIPLYGILLWTYFDPEESYLWGKRWMYKEDPEISDSAIRYAKVASAISMVVLTIFLFLILLN